MNKQELIQLGALLNEIEKELNKDTSSEFDNVKEVLENNGYKIDNLISHTAIHKSKEQHKESVIKKGHYLRKFADEELEGKDRQIVYDFATKIDN